MKFKSLPILLLIICFLIKSKCVFSQTIVWEKEVTIAHPNSITTDPLGNITYITNTLQANSPWFYAVSKVNRSGDSVWQNVFKLKNGIPYYYVGGGNKIKNNPSNGDLHIMGPAFDTLNGQYVSNGENISCLDFKGHLKWSTKFLPGHIPGGYWEDITIDKSGSTYVLGWNSALSGYGPTDTAWLGNLSVIIPKDPTSFDKHIFVGKIDSNGNPVWLKGFVAASFNPNHDTRSWYLYVDANNHLYLSGVSELADQGLSFDGISFTTARRTAFIAGLNSANGQCKWARRINSTPAQPSTNGTADAFLAGNNKNQVILVGRHSDNIVYNTVTYPLTQGRGYIAAYDTLGNEKWAKRYGIRDLPMHGLSFNDTSYYIAIRDTLMKLDTIGNIIYAKFTKGIIAFSVAPDESIAQVTLPFVNIDKILKWLGKTNIVSGIVFYDLNGNGIKDAGENGVPNIIVKASPNRFAALTDANGYYECMADSGNHVFNTNAILYHTSSPVAGYNINLPGYYSNLSGNNFAMSIIPNIIDAEVDFTATGPSRPGFNTTYALSIKNKGTTTISGTAGIKLPSRASYQASDSIPLFNAGDSLSFSYTNLRIGETRRINIVCRTSTNATNNDTLKFYSLVLPVLTDTIKANNYDTLFQRVTGSFDPNDKLSFPPKDILIAAKNNPVEYTIRFQNTGNDTAFNIIVKDTISNKLDLNSFEFISSSHPVTVKIESEKYLYFYLDNIQLVDSVHNEPKSHGFIKFRIRPVSSVIIGDSIINTASIYFDYNLPVKTNSTLNLFATLVVTGITELINGNNIKLYPNPANNEIYYRFKDPLPGTIQIKIHSINGNLIKTYKINTSQQNGSIKLNNLIPGVYIIQMESRNKVYKGKFVVQ